MRGEREIAVRELIKNRTQELASGMTKLPQGASEPSEEMLAAMIELEDLQSELEVLSDDAQDSGEPQVGVRAPLNPQPHLKSGAVALPVLEESKN
jgi:hypothetical protein